MPTNRRFLVIAFTSVVLGTMTTFGFARLNGLTANLNRFITSQSQKMFSAKLVDLPLEVLIEILTLLEWKDILRIRQTCQRLRDASLARPVWLSLVQWHFSTIQPRPFLPEKPLDLHTDRELEHLIRKWQRGRALMQPNKLPLSIPEDYLQGVYLIQGGRWLLFGARDGSIKYHDLNFLGETSEAVTLVPSHFDDDANTIVLLSVDMDPAAEYMAFNLGIMTCRVDPLDHDPDYPNPPRYARWIEVNRIASYWDENGQVKGLQAERLACFREEYMCGCDSFTLRGFHVAYSLYSFQPISSLGEGQNIVIVDWTSADSTSLAYPRRLILRCRAKWLAILSDNRLLCDIGVEILLFDLNDALVTTLLPTLQNQSARQDPLARLRLFVHAISQPYHIHDSIRFAVLTRKGINGLIIPHSSSVSHTIDSVDLLSHSDFSNFAHVGYNRAVLCYSPQPIVLQYAWPEEHSSPVVSKEITIQTPYCPQIIFDEYSSRLINGGVGSKIVSILDLAAI